MLCETCQKHPATVHLTIETRTVTEQDGVEANASQPTVKEHHFCEGCADEYYKTKGMNSSRDLIQLSDRFRATLYDRLEQEHREVFRPGNEKGGAEIMFEFLREQLQIEGIEPNDDVLDMLFHSFVGSAEFYERRDRLFGDGST